MEPRLGLNAELEAFVGAALSALGFDLVELRMGGSRRRPVVDVRMDRRDGSKVSIDDCAAVSRALEPKLEESGLLPEQYVLEVSSPGVERPLRRPADWTRFAGREVSVKSTEWSGRRRMTIVGLSDDAGDVAVLRDASGAETRVALSQVTEARLVFNWKN